MAAAREGRGVGPGPTVRQGNDREPSVPPGRGRPLAPALRDRFGGLFRHDFSRVRVHAGPGAATAAAAVGARAFTVGRHVVLGSPGPDGRGEQPTPVLAHELAHVVQQRGAEPTGPVPVGGLRDPAEGEAATAARAVLQGRPAPPLSPGGLVLRRLPDTLAAVPQAERTRLRVATIAVTVPPERIQAFFAPGPNGPPGERRSVPGTNRFAPGIDASLHTGLGSVAAWIAGDTNALPLGASVEVDLDLSAHGGALTTYRFTYFEHTEGTGAAATTGRVMLIEAVGAALAAPAPRTLPSDHRFTVGSSTFTLRGSWSEAEYALLRQALDLLPAAALATASGMTFRRGGASGGPEAGEYHSDTNTVELFHSAFPGSDSLRIGQRSRAVHNILHEVGHAIDLLPLEQAWTTFNAANQSASARRTFLGVRSPSGSRWVGPDAETGNFNQSQAMDDATGGFRAALRRDGVARDTGGRVTPEGTTAQLSGGVTTYGETDYQEMYAETFALYVNAPETLRLLRPATYAWFLARFPR